MTDNIYEEMTALVIDNQKFVITIISKMLTQIGFGRILTAIDGETGFDVVVTHKPDIIICEIAMKPVDGLEFLQRIRGEPSAAIAQIPVILITSELSVEVVVKAKELGVNATMIKPVLPVKLREKIDSLFGKNPEENEVVALAPESPPRLKSKTVPEEMPYANLRALVVDDQAVIRRVISGFLRQMGFQFIMEAADGTDAIKVNNEFMPDIILCDIEMKPMDGLTFLQILRSEDGIVNNNVPFIFLSSHSDSDNVKHAKKLGVNAFLVKPISLKLISDRVNFVLGRKVLPR